MKKNSILFTNLNLIHFLMKKKDCRTVYATALFL